MPQTNLRIKFSRLVLFLSCIALTLFTHTSPAQTPKTTPFAVAAIHRNMGEYGAWGIRFTSTGLDVQNAPLRAILQQAYDIRDDFRLSAPAWVTSARYDIQARIDPEQAARFQSESTRHQMLRDLLADRFHLLAHMETRNLLAYALTAARSGAKIQPSAAPKNAPNEPPPLCHMAPGARMDLWPIQSCTMENLARMLSSAAERPVIDRTGLQGRYDFTLHWVRNAQWRDEAGTSLFTALKEQLGLSLEATKTPLDVVVVDQIEPPSEN